jgi:hypothetical protein
MAQIHSSGFATEEMFEYLDKTRTILAAATDGNLLCDDDYNFFFMNSMLQVEELTVAPAA